MLEGGEQSVQFGQVGVGGDFQFFHGCNAVGAGGASQRLAAARTVAKTSVYWR